MLQSRTPTHIPTAYSIFSLLSVVSSLLENRCLTLPNSLAFFEVLAVELAELQALLRRRCGYPDGASGSVASAALPGTCQRGTQALDRNAWHTDIPSTTSAKGDATGAV